SATEADGSSPTLSKCCWRSPSRRSATDPRQREGRVLIRNESFEVLTHGAGTLPREAGLVGIVRRLPGCLHRFGCHCPRPDLLALRVVPDLYEAVADMVRSGDLQRELKAAPPPSMVNVITKATCTVGNGETLLEKIWPEDPVANV